METPTYEQQFACLECMIVWTGRVPKGVPIEAHCPKCGGRYGTGTAYRTDSTAFAYAVLDKEDDLSGGVDLMSLFTEYEPED